VRGPKRAAARRLIQGMVATSAAVALLAPAAGASTVTAPHPLDPVDPLAVTYTAGAGEANNLTLTGNGTTLSFAETVALISLPDPGGVGGLDADDCTAPGETTATCQSNAATTVDLGDGDDSLTLGANLPALNIIGGAGTDRLDFSPQSTGVSIDLGGSTPNLAVNTVENVMGGSGDDTIDGDAAGNRLAGGAGVDTLNGGAGVNNLRGGDGNDTLNAGNDGDTLVGGAGVDSITGGAGDDDISAADGAVDQITCGGGFDTVSADPTDTFGVQADCEEITFAASSTPDPVPDPTPPNPPVAPKDTTFVFVPVLGSVAPVLAPGKPDITDLIPPRAAMRSASRHRIATILKRGVPVRVTCQESCGISVALSVDRTAAKRLKLDARTSPVVIGTATATRTLAGSSVLRVKLTKKAKAAFKKSKRSVVSNTQVLVSDATGNGTLLQRHVTLVR
jgi:hypothetical protein